MARIGNDPALRSTAQGDTVMDLSLAFTLGRKGSDGKYATTWVKATLWGARCEKLHPYLSKGQQIYVELSELHMSSYEKKDGSGTATDLRARINTINFAGESKAKDEQKKPVSKQEDSKSFSDLDDDIPF